LLPILLLPLVVLLFLAEPPPPPLLLLLLPRPSLSLLLLVYLRCCRHRRRLGMARPSFAPVVLTSFVWRVLVVSALSWFAELIQPLARLDVSTGGWEERLWKTNTMKIVFVFVTYWLGHPFYGSSVVLFAAVG